MTPAAVPADAQVGISQPAAWLVVPARGHRGEAVFLGSERPRAEKYAVGVRGVLVALVPRVDTRVKP